ncbi:hypothetical protein [Paludibaculum fermentans]|uniref:hypothetical protein n=1 Tax=Paludibaculum fermentans TaxID=1473598 RepID=UPI003EBDDB93
MKTPPLRHLACLLSLALPCLSAVRVDGPAKPSPREAFGIQRLRDAAAKVSAPGKARILAGTFDSGLFQSLPGVKPFEKGTREAFRLQRHGDTWLIAGSDASGVMYGCLELAQRIAATGKLPAQLDESDQPKFVLRGPSIGMQKTEITYDGAIYDYRYTPEEFPFFYDRQHWTEYLDFLVKNRMNTLYLWNGHPFTSLLKLPKYPDAQELTDQQLETNMEMFRWLTAEADRRGIWVIQLFYNIHISHALAKARGLSFHLSAPTPFVSEYTRYCVAEFIRTYPNVGLMMTLGEALAPRFGPEWLSKTIIPGVQDGMKALGITQEPPIIVRAHATQIEEAMKQALPLYKNIFTMHKWNGESLTWTDVRGEVLRLHQSLANLGSTHIANVHILANLEPFRWGSPEFIRQAMQSQERIGIRGLHLYPLRYWDWPVTADRTAVPLKQIDRDWIWYEAWARYAWNPQRDAAAEREYWIGRLNEKYGSSKAAGQLLDAYQLAGICAPKLLTRIGITEGNRQAFSLGMLMTQIINPERYNALTLLWTGDAPPGERLPEWVEREWNHQPHEGETPPGVAAEVKESARRALAAAEAARPDVRRNQEEYERLVNDLRCIYTMMSYYEAKTRAAALILRYGHSHDWADVQKALAPLEESLAQYRKLVELTETTYREACSVHSASRRIPFLGAPGRFTHWRDCLPIYEQELATFRRRLAQGQSFASGNGEQQRAAFAGLSVKLTAGAGEIFQVEPGTRLYKDKDTKVSAMAGELKGLTGIRIAREEAVQKGVHLEFELSEPAQVLVGFFKSSSRNAAAAPPKDEWEPVLWNGVAAEGHPAMTVYSHALTAGRNDLDFGRGAYVVLGFIPRTVRPEPRMVFLAGAATNQRPDLDWLFE